MTTEMKGPVTDLMPPLVGKIHKWIFRNLTGKKIYFINILTGPLEKDMPKMEGVHFFIENEVRYMNINKDCLPLSLSIRELFYEHECIKPDQIFEIQLNFKEPFKTNQYIHFSPADQKSANIIAHINIATDRRDNLSLDINVIEALEEERILIDNRLIDEIQPEINNEELFAFFNSVRNGNEETILSNQKQMDTIRTVLKDDTDTFGEVMDDILDSDEEENLVYTEF